MIFHMATNPKFVSVAVIGVAFLPLDTARAGESEGSARLILVAQERAMLAAGR